MQQQVEQVVINPHTEHVDMPSLSAFDRPQNSFQLLWQMLMLIIKLMAKIIDLNAMVKELEAKIQKLYEQANLDSETSGIPPSKDWKRCGGSGGSKNGQNVGQEDNGKSKNAADQNDNQKDDDKKETPIPITGYLEPGEKKRLGGQKNHPPAFMRFDSAQERDPVLHYPGKCTNCPHFERCVEEGRFRQQSTSHEYDVEVVLVHREHQQFEATDCLEDGQPISEDFPEVIGTQFYGFNVQLHVLTWHHIFHGSYGRIDQAAKELLGLSLSAATANAIVRRTSAKILDCGFMDALRFFILLFEIVMGVDETSANVGARKAWVHTAVTANVTLLTAHWRRGYEGSIYAGVLQFYINTLISDCWASYFNEKFKFRHAICDGHILRELVAAAYFRQQRWAIEMFDLLLEIFEAKRDAIERGEKSLPQEYIADIRARYRQIVADGFYENSGETKGKTISLLERLNKLEDAALAFAVDFNVDFTNNASEQSLRNLKVALRVIGQFKTMLGLADYCIIQSFMDTCRKQGHNPFDILRILLSGGDIIEAVFGAEKAAKIKQMIELANAFAFGDETVINAIMADMMPFLTEELIEAARYSRFKAYDEPPPENKKPSTDVPKDKMQAARIIVLKKSNQTTSVPSADSQLNTAVLVTV